MVTLIEEKTMDTQDKIINLIYEHLTQEELELLKGHDLHFEKNEIYFI